MNTCILSGRVSVHSYYCFSHKGAGDLHHTQCHLDGLHYQHILQNVTVPSVRVFYPGGNHLQQDQHSINDSRVVQ